MYLVKKIVVGIEMPPSHPWDAANLEAPSRLAVRQAFQLAASAKLPVSLVTVLPEPNAGWFGSAEQARRDHEVALTEANSVLQDLAAQYATESNIVVECVVGVGKPWMELLRVAGNADDTMIICGSRPVGAVSRALFGSTGLKLLRYACGPVWLVKAVPDDDDRLDILATTDLTEIGGDILGLSVGLAKCIPSRLSVLHVAEGTVERYMRRTGVSVEQLEEMRARSIEEATHRVHDQLAQTDFRTLENGVQVKVASGPADVGILNAIQNLNINVVVMASQARGGVSGMVLGNTAETLLSEVSCSLIVIKPDDFKCPLQF
ncbi:MAG: universal stress protein [Planctomycetaceae bacterium]|nr:universal stress protein [Planctomycetaceae bacterium]